MPTKLPKDAVCLQCSYPLRGLATDRCPECGRDFKASDPLSYGPTPQWTIRLAAGPKRWHVGVTVAALVVYLADHSSPATWLLHGESLTAPPHAWATLLVLLGCIWHCNSLRRLVLTLIVFVALILVLEFCYFPGSLCADLDVGGHVAMLWLVVAGLHAVAARLARHQLQDWGKSCAGIMELSRVRRRVMSVCLVLFVTALVLSWPFALRFALSRPALERAAASYVQAGRGNLAPQWIGLFSIQAVRVQPRGTIRFELSWHDDRFFCRKRDTLLLVPAGQDLGRDVRWIPWGNRGRWALVP